jgi:hypothetical protein
MTIEELVNKLNTYPPQLKVFVMTESYHRELEFTGLSDWNNGQGDLFNVIPYGEQWWMGKPAGTSDEVYLEIEV